jgi:hypothetical protein
MSARVMTSTLAAVSATCSGCAWSTSARNALGNAARHHDRTGHVVSVEEHRQVTYGDSATAPAGQESLLAQLGLEG